MSTLRQTIKGLQDGLNDTVAKVTPKSRFQFKRSAHVDMGAPENDPRLDPGSLARNPHPKLAPAAEDTVPELPAGKNYNEEMARPSDSPLRKPSFSAARDIGISHHTGLHIILPSSAARATAAGSLTDLKGCIVDMSVPTAEGAPFPGLALKGIDRSLIVAGHVAGAVHMTGVTDSIVVVTARQVRIHECRNVDIYLHSSSHPIIEDCSGMRFAPLPSHYVCAPGSLTMFGCLRVMLTRKKVAEVDEKVENQWDQVDDFKWLKAGHSPNWTILSEAERLGEEVWKTIVPGQPGVRVDETLKKVNLPTR